MRNKFNLKWHDPLADGDRRMRAYFAYAEFSIVLLLALSLGIALFFFVDHSQDTTSKEIIASHFSKPFSNVNSFFDVLWIIIKTSLADIVPLLLLYAFAYSRAFPVVAGGIFVYKGVIFGYSSSFLGYKTAASDSLLDNIALLFFLDVLVKLAVINVLIWAASNLFADPIKAKKPSENAKLILSKSTICAISIGSVLTIQILYSLILQLICK